MKDLLKTIMMHEHHSLLFRDGHAICSYLLLIGIGLLLVPQSLKAQQTFTEHLTRSVAGEGTVILHQDAEIEALVNTPNSEAQHSSAESHKLVSDSISSTSEALHHITPGHRSQIIGYRIQVYAGGNNRRSKAEAHHMANLVRSSFDNVSVYTSFISPRWVCRVGDYKTREEASEQLRKMRATNMFGEASIVKSKIIVHY